MPCIVVSDVCESGMTASKHTQVHDVVAADGTVVDDNVPGPESDSVPLMTSISDIVLLSAMRYRFSPS